MNPPNLSMMLLDQFFIKNLYQRPRERDAMLFRLVVLLYVVLVQNKI
jgi:hypothetical protein